MSNEVSDLRSTIVPKSDQLNAEQLLGGPMVITVADVRVRNSDEQPISVHYRNDDGRPFKPCKTMRKVLIHAWGADGNEWVGKSMELYNDPIVRFGDQVVGGIRIARLTDIPRDIKVALTATKGKKALHEIKRMDDPNAADFSASKTVEDLKEQFGASYKATRDKTWRETLKRAYDQRMAELTPPDPQTGEIAEIAPPAGADGPTYAQIADQITKATSAETAMLALDAALDWLQADQHDELGDHYRRTWPVKGAK